MKSTVTKTEAISHYLPTSNQRKMNTDKQTPVNICQIACYSATDFKAALVSNIKAFILQLTHMKQKHSCEERLSLAVANVFIIDRVCLEKTEVNTPLNAGSVIRMCYNP